MSAISDPSIESKVAFLRQPMSFPEATYRVEAIETHMSWIFLTDGYAYKLKKPVRNAFLDFYSIDARRYYCEEEIRLNRRLAADVYLGMVALSLDALGHMQLGEDGTIIDWLVKMRRLPVGRMLDYAIVHGSADAQDINRIAARLAAFYRSATPIAIDCNSYRERFQFEIECNQQELARPAYCLPVKQVQTLCAAQRAVLYTHQDLLDARAQAGRVVEGHGDLRPEHICLESPVVVIDCLEFSASLRIIDPADELGFLALECERLGAPEFGALLLQSYGEASGDWPNPVLLHFYQSFRASLRARIAIKHLDEEKFRYSYEWRRRAQIYLRLAESHQKFIANLN